MTDKKFFEKQSSLALKDMAVAACAQLAETADPEYMIEDVAPLDTAGARDVSFLDNVKYKDQFLATKAGACIIRPEMQSQAPEGLNLIISEHPYKSYALVAQNLYPQEQLAEDISEYAYIHPSVKIGKDCRIESGVVIGENAEIGNECWIEANAVVGANVSIGDHCRIGANASVSHALIANHVRLYPGVCVGQDGFGFAIDPDGHVKVPQLGRVVIEDHVEIGANTTIDRGSGPDTVIGQGTWIDNQVQIGHNVKIGKGCIIVSQVGISGSTVIEDYVALAGQVGVAGHLRIGKGAQIAAGSGVIQDVPAGEEQMGYPSQPIKQFMRQVVTLKRLIKTEKSS